MNIFTSYFSNVRNLPPDVVPVSIARYSPLGWDHRKAFEAFAPSYALFKRFFDNRDEQEYIRAYNVQLGRLCLPNILGSLERAFDGKDVAFICYERPGVFCHRHLVAKWLIDNGIPVSEYEIKEYKSER